MSEPSVHGRDAKTIPPWPLASNHHLYFGGRVLPDEITGLIIISALSTAAVATM